MAALCYELGFLQVGPHLCLYTQIRFSANDLLWDSLIFSVLPKCKERDSGWVCKLITDNPNCGLWKILGHLIANKKHLILGEKN